jgi:acyl carrier protein
MTAEQRRDIEAPEIERRIISFVQRELLAPGATVTRDDDLLSGDLLDSIGVLRLSAFVGEEFHVEMRPGDFVIENFKTVAVLSEYVRRAADRGGRPPADTAR